MPNPTEVETVNAIFRRYLKLGSVHRLCAELKAQGVLSKSWVTAKGRTMGGLPISRGALFYLLRNRHYRGEIVHKEKTYPGRHAAIVDAELFESVQVRLDSQTQRTRRSSAKAASALLTGRVYDGEGCRFSPTFSTGRHGRIHRYYVASEVQQGRTAPEGAIRRVGADALESLVVAELQRISGRQGSTAELLPLLLRLELRPEETHLVLDQARLFGLDHPELAAEDLRDRLRPDERVVTEPGQTPALRMVLPRRMQLRRGRTWAVFTAAQSEGRRVDTTLVTALQRAHELAREVDARAPTNEYDRRLVRLVWLAPDLQKAILTGRQPLSLTLALLLKTELPRRWSQQRLVWGRL